MTKKSTKAQVQAFARKVQALAAKRDAGEFTDAKSFTRAVDTIEQGITPDLVHALRVEASAGDTLLLQREAGALIFKSEKSWNSWERGGRTPSLADLSHFMLATGLMPQK